MIIEKGFQHLLQTESDETQSEQLDTTSIPEDLVQTFESIGEEKLRKISEKLGLPMPGKQNSAVIVEEHFLVSYSDVDSHAGNARFLNYSVDNEVADHMNVYRVRESMEEIIIHEGHSVGLFQFGMNIEEVEEYKKHYIEKYNCLGQTFQFDYNDEGQVVYIQLAIEHLKSDFECKFKGIDIFNTKAAKLVEYFDTINPDNETKNATDDFDYLYPELGLSFWRGHVCTEEYLESEEFKEQIPENQEDFKRFLYFETVGFHKV